MNIYIKTLSGEIQTLTFFEKEVTIEKVEKTLYKKNYKVTLFKNKDEDEGDLKEDKILSDGDMLNVFYERQDFTQEENLRFETRLARKIEFVPQLKEALSRFGAIVAGGSVLSNFGNYEINDLDIYIHYSKAYEFILFLSKYSYIGNVHSAPAYDQSFFRKNNIIGRVLMYTSHVQGVFRVTTPIDVMIIPDEIPLEKIVTNFDLTFCQVWWDGEKISSNDIEDVRSKKGSLNKDYINSYLSMNEFIIKRVAKYKKRGFKISIDMSSFTSSDLIIDIDKETSKKSIKNCKQQWVLTKICDHAYDRIHHQGRSLLFFDIYPSEFTIESCISIYTEDVFYALVKHYYFDHCIYFQEKYKESFIDLFGNLLTDIDEENYDFTSDNRIIQEWVNEKTEKLRGIIQVITRERVFDIRQFVNYEEIFENNPQLIVQGNLVVNGDMVVNGNMIIGNPENQE